MIHCLGDSVRIEEELSAWRESDLVFGIRGRYQPERQAGIDIKKRALAIDEKRPQMSGTGNRDLSRVGIEYTVDHGDEFSCWKIFHKHLIQLHEGSSRRRIQFRERAQDGACR